MKRYDFELGICIGNHSYIVTSKEADAIHSENVALLSSMSQKEIEEKQKELLQNLDASNVKFLRNRRKKQAHHDRITNGLNKIIFNKENEGY